MLWRPLLAGDLCLDAADPIDVEGYGAFRHLLRQLYAGAAG
jgi:hypothetical protein